MITMMQLNIWPADPLLLFQLLNGKGLIKQDSWHPLPFTISISRVLKKTQENGHHLCLAS